MKKLLICIMLGVMMTTMSSCGKKAETNQPTTVGTEEKDVFDIKTDVVTLKYPTRWKDKVNIVTDKTSVKFSSDKVQLFDLYFNEQPEDSSLLGMYGDTPIYIVSYNFDETNLDETKFQEYCQMQEDINVILNYLSKDKNFKMD